MNQRFEAFMTGITVCYKCIQRIKTHEMTEFNLKGAHAMCLFFLRRNPEGLTSAQLCQLCAEDKATISRMLSTLQERGYVESADRKYRALIRLTESGERIARRVDELVEQWVASGGDGLSEEERNVFYHSLGVISENLRCSLEKCK